MTRVRLPADRMDGAAVQPQNRPPADLIPAAFAERLAEYDQLRIERDHADQDLRDMDEKWAILRQDAIRADARSAMTAAREGSPLPVNEAVDALDARRESIRSRRAGLDLAVQELPNDINNVRYQEQTNGDYVAQVAKARADLRKATAQVKAKAEALVRAVALHEWLHDQLPWDERIDFAATDVVPGLAGVVGYQINPMTTNLAALLDAIDNL